MSSQPSDFSEQPQSAQEPLEHSPSLEFCEPSAQELVLKAEDSAQADLSQGNVCQGTGATAEPAASEQASVQNSPIPAAPPVASLPASSLPNRQAVSPSIPDPPPSSSASTEKLINTLGNPHACEDDWIRAAEQLGDSQSRSRQHSRKYWTVFFALLALFISILGYSVVSILSFVQAPVPTPHLATSPTPPPPVAAAADIDFGPYMADLQRRIKRAWFPPKGEESKRVVVVFKIHDDGTLSNLRLDRTSGAKLADQAALRAVENAAPFKPLPAGASKDVDIQFTFDYNVFGGSGKGN